MLRKKELHFSIVGDLTSQMNLQEKSTTSTNIVHYCRNVVYDGLQCPIFS